MDSYGHIAVLGAGSAGVACALELAELYPCSEICIYEKESTVLPPTGTSYQTPGRAGHGFHYIHPSTAIQYLKSTLDVIKSFPDSRLSSRFPGQEHLKFGMYVIMKSREEILMDLIEDLKKTEEKRSDINSYGAEENEKIALSISKKGKQKPLDELLSDVRDQPSLLSPYLNDTEQLEKLLRELFPGREWKSHSLENRLKFSSLFKKEKILDTFAQINDAYTNLVETDPANEVFGEPGEQFFKVEDLRNYKHINPKYAAAIVRTREELVCWPWISETMREQVKKQGNITLRVNRKIQNVRRTDDGFEIMSEDIGDGRDFVETVGSVVNATWQDVSRINQTAKLSVCGPRAMRLKAIATIKLPKSLLNHPSVFFCMGPHCMFSNMGDGTAKITYAPVTNMESTKDVEVSSAAMQFLNFGNVEFGNCDEGLEKARKEIGKKIMTGVASYLPAIAEAELIGVKFGIIQTGPNTDIFDPESDIHERSKYGVKVKWPREALHEISDDSQAYDAILSLSKPQEYWNHLFVENLGMKLMFFKNNAILVRNIFKKFEKVRRLSKIIHIVNEHFDSHHAIAKKKLNVHKEILIRKSD